MNFVLLISKKIFHALLLLLFFLSIPAINLHPQSSSVSHYWMLEEETAPFKDFYTPLNIWAKNAPNQVPGIVGHAQGFDPQDEVYIDPDSSLEWLSGQSFSIEFWMKDSTTSAVENEVIIGRDDSGSVDGSNVHWWIGVNDVSGYPEFTLFDNFRIGTSVIGSASVLDGDWHHIVAVRNGVQNKNLLYVDGQLAAQDSFDYMHDFTALNTPIQIGLLNDYLNNNDYHYDGVLDELAFHNIALSQSVIERHFENGLEKIGYRGKILQLFLDNPRQDSSKFLFDIFVQNAGLLSSGELSNFLGISTLSLTRDSSVVSGEVRISSQGPRFSNNDYSFTTQVDPGGNIVVDIDFTYSGAAEPLRLFARELLCTIEIPLADSSAAGDSLINPDIRWIPEEINVMTGDSVSVPVFLNEFETEPLAVNDPSVNLLSFELKQNYPNPFNPATNFGFRIPALPVRSDKSETRRAGGSDFGFVSLKIYDILGNEVAVLVNEYKPAGEYNIQFNAGNLSSGVYLYTLSAGRFIQTKKMILMK